MSVFKIEGGGSLTTTGVGVGDVGTTTGINVHCAYIVILLVTPGLYGNTRALPPVDAANHPLKVYPLRVGLVGAAETEDPDIKDPLLTVLPPCESKVTE